MQTMPQQLVRRVACKGTTSVIEPVKSQNWTGEEFKEHEKHRLSLLNNPLLMKSRGTDTFRANQYAQTSIPVPKGHYLVTGRGTGLTKLG